MVLACYIAECRFSSPLSIVFYFFSSSTWIYLACSATYNSLCMCLWVSKLNERICSSLFYSKEEGKRLRSRRECERKETGGVTSFSPWEKCSGWKLGKSQRNPDPVTIRQKGGDLKGEGKWKQVPVQGDRTVPPSLPFLSKCPSRRCMRLCNIRVG